MRLYRAIVHWSTSREAMGVGATTAAWSRRVDGVLAAQTIPLKRIGKATTLVYTCAIAQRLAFQSHHAATIAAQLVDTLLQDSPDDVETSSGVSVQATVAGFIHFEVSDRTIAAWLDQLLANALLQPPLSSAPTAERERQMLLSSAAIFDAQYAHARCCSLLRLAHHETLIRLERHEEAPFYWRISSPTPFPWLTTAAQLSLSHSADRCLLVQLLEAFDHLYDLSQKRTPVSMARSAQAVAQAFQNFHRVHPLWNHEQEPALVTASLGLLMATQRILYLLLADGLHLCPVIEL